MTPSAGDNMKVEAKFISDTPTGRPTSRCSSSSGIQIQTNDTIFEIVVEQFEYEWLSARWSDRGVPRNETRPPRHLADDDNSSGSHALDSLTVFLRSEQVVGTSSGSSLVVA
jgi:hypothetical protein